MRKVAQFCDVCAGEGKVTLARGFYRYTADSPRYEACRKHLHVADKAGALTMSYDFVGDLDPCDFME